MKKLVLAVALVAGLSTPAAVGAASVLKARMTGAEIVNDDGGAPRGVAQATLTVNGERHLVCFEIAYGGLGGKAAAGYLRQGGRGQMSRPAAVLFSGRAASPVEGCVDDLDPRTISGLQEKPGGYSVDLATRKLPKGAVRGQLHAGGDTEQELEGPASGGIGRP